MDLGIGGKSYVLVGGSRGMGWETARILAEEGGNVAILSRNPSDAGDRAAMLARRCRVKVVALRADVTLAGSIDDAIAAAIAALGPLRGIAITNFISSRGSPLNESADEEWERFFQDVLMGTVRTCRAIVPHFLGQGAGNIVTTGALSARSPKSYLLAYASLKASVVNFTKNLAKPYGPLGIRANCVCPGAVETQRSKARIDALVQAENLPRLEAERRVMADMMMNPALGRLGRPAEVGDMIAFLLSERAAYASGLIANVDGGTDF